MELLWSDFHIFREYEALILMNFSALVSLLVSKVIISSVTKMEIDIIHSEITILAFFTMVISMLEVMGQYEAAVIALALCVTVNVLTIGIFIHGAITQITQYLGIHCFSLEKREKGKQKE